MNPLTDKISDSLVRFYSQRLEARFPIRLSNYYTAFYACMLALQIVCLTFSHQAWILIWSAPICVLCYREMISSADAGARVRKLLVNIDDTIEKYFGIKP